MLINGSHSVLETLKKGVSGTLYIHKQHKSYSYISFLAKKNNCRIEIMSLQELKMKGAYQGILFDSKAVPQSLVPNLKQWLAEREDNKLALFILDHILDPQNLGAIMRSACLLNIDLIVMPEKRMAPENAIAARSAAGAMNLIPRCYESNLANAVTLLKKNNIWVYGLDMKGTNLSQTKLPERSAFILGNEHKGISPILHKASDEILSIDNNMKLDSFNVSVSAALVGYEYYKQHYTK